MRTKVELSQLEAKFAGMKPAKVGGLIFTEKVGPFKGDRDAERLIKRHEERLESPLRICCRRVVRIKRSKKRLLCSNLK